MNKSPFQTEPPSYTKGAWADLQGAWENLRQAMVNAIPFPRRSGSSYTSTRV
jgi:hypothetical protein